MPDNLDSHDGETVTEFADRISQRQARLGKMLDDMEAARATEAAARARVNFTREEAYRRGYWHGYSQAMDDLRAAYGPRAWKQSVRWWKAWDAVAKFFDGAVAPWRFARHGGQRDEPPTFRAQR